MLFSVCIPIYGAASFLDRCLSSILEQQFKDYELLLVDDGSWDESAVFCEEYTLRYPQIRVIHARNAGPAAARNTAIECASGNYLMFVDADDEVLPGYFRVLAEEIQKKTVPLYWFGCLHNDGVHKEEKTSPAVFLNSREDILDFLEFQFCKSQINNHKEILYSSYCDTHSCWNKVFSCRLIGKETRFPIGTVVEEDLRFNLRLLEQTEMLDIIPDILYCYHQQATGSVTTKYNPVKFESKLAAYREEKNFAERMSRPAIRNFFQDSLLSYVSSCTNNLCYASCPLSTRQKLLEIRRFFQATEVQEAVRECHPRSRRTRIMRWLISNQLVMICWLIHRLGQYFRRR